MKTFLSNCKISIFLIIISFGFTIREIKGADLPKILNLRTEYKINPIGIESPNPRLSWEIVSKERNFMQSAYQIRAAHSIKDLESNKNLVWDTKKIVSDQSIQVEYSGNKLFSAERVYWQIKIWGSDESESQWSESAYWEMGLLNVSDWKAKWIEPNLVEVENSYNPSPQLRKEFSLNKKIVNARAYVTSHGLYEFHLNGKKISNQLFTPGWTSYNKRLQYQVYDITSDLISGKNAIGVILGDGWYRGPLTWDYTRNIYGNKLGLLLQIVFQYSDGTAETIISDDSWKSTTGPIIMSGIYDGEIYDARIENNKWMKSDFDDKNWSGVITKDFDNKNLVASEGAEVRITEEIKPIKKFVTPNGELVFDFGQNMVGWVQFKLKGNVGDKIVLRHAEVLDQNGNIYLANLRKAKQKIEYIFKGEGEETFEPHFSFQGFRYVSISDYSGQVELSDLTGKVIHSDMKQTGNFTCSDSLINQLQKNIYWGLRGNFLDVPTDCPQRDERLGWTGDAQVFAPTACFNVDAASFFTKWMKDFEADQLSDGRFPHVVPNMLINAGGAAGWADAGIIVPWTIYQNYGDKRILEVQYPSMKKWIEYLKKNAGESFIWSKGVGYGDWLAFATTKSDYPGATTDKDLIGTAYFYYSTNLMYNIASVIGKNEDAKEYFSLMKNIKEAFQKEFITSTGRIASNTQTAYLLALAYDLYPDNFKPIAAERLAEDVKRFGHITSGFLGSSHIAKILSDFGYHELAFKLLFRTDYPSWLYPVTKGATTIWERWDGIRANGTFQSDGMNSFNHYAYGAIGKWLYSDIAGIGIDPEKPAYKNIIVNPLTNDKLKFANANFHSMYGDISSSWKLENGKFLLRVEIPANNTADIYLPTEIKENISESGKPIKDILGINSIKIQNGKTVITVGSGTYNFEVVK
ncbi:MAG: glycoside hydrolase family 78 protein [Melioribacteraceae bacterium]